VLLELLEAMADSSQQPSAPILTGSTLSANSLPPAALDLASKLFNLARVGDTSALELYVTAGIPPNLTDSRGNTLLMLAAYHGHAKTVTMLLQHGADVDAANDRGQSPLAGAVFKGYADIVVILVKAGADVNGGMPSPIDTAKMFKREDLLEVMDSQTNKNV